MSVSKGDRVTIDGKSARITGSWGQGKTRVFQLDDGRTVYDLHLLLAEGDAEVAEEQVEVEESLGEDVFMLDSDPGEVRDMRRDGKKNKD
jgi:hypothetical protein